MLRPRTDKFFADTVDGLMTVSRHVLDAIRIRDNADVAFKILLKNSHVYGQFVEVEIGTFFSSDPLAKDPRNHCDCVPILDVLHVPDNEYGTIIVLPLLREYRQPRFDTFGEAVDILGQIFEVRTVQQIRMAQTRLNSVASSSRDCSDKAKFYNRTQRPPKYYLIDFGLSRKYPTRDPPPLEPPIIGGDKTVPEHQRADPCDPFPTDIYVLGNMILRKFTVGESLASAKLFEVEFMRPLVDGMVAVDPAKRPTMDEAVARFATVRAGLSSWKPRSRVVKETDMPFPIVRSRKHWLRRIGYILTRTPAIPCYNSNPP
ncbi:hypothetical protein B0H17DRAFT_1162153 [Mycena rosella]|uniref:Protein kinase domain-containing protein n=1 Tax=Mycena rosella TaxID=1033263 RepID=A0AAD7CZ20_MYCRO|nr:hypothetical protein B0H17DRAFT_1162153 [Mycena rosella]